MTKRKTFSKEFKLEAVHLLEQGDRPPNEIALELGIRRNQNATINMVWRTLIMPALTIKNIPDDLYNAIKYVAKQHHRSINSEVIVCLKKTLLPSRISPDERLKNIQALRSQIKPGVITADEIDQAINEGIP